MSLLQNSHRSREECRIVWMECQFVAMPSRRRKDGKFRDIAHPLNRETRAVIEERVLELYHKELKGLGDQPPPPIEEDYDDALPEFDETESDTR